MWYQLMLRDVNENISQLELAGCVLRARHDDSKIADLIAQVEQLESESSEVTAKVLRTMMGIDDSGPNDED